ncbi:MAG: hypothetical protein IT379_02980 [Deltaproteobacteria bacterium]|nr:hypothetical protein [Deltaproteobacteria bacterium]
MRVAVAWASAGWLVFAMGTVACSGDDDGGPAAPRLGGGCDAAQAAECLVDQHACEIVSGGPECFGCAPGMRAERDGTCVAIEGTPLQHRFADFTTMPGEEILGLCQSWTLQNEEDLYVTGVELMQGGMSHHSNWLWVPDSLYEGEDGVWPCEERGYSQTSAVIAGGGVVYAQSTQALREVQQFPPGSAVRIPARARIISGVHVLNVGSEPVTSHIELTLYSVPREQISVVLAPFHLDLRELDIQPRTTTRGYGECDLGREFRNFHGREPHFVWYWGLPHTHMLASRFFVQAMGGPRDGEYLIDLRGFDGEAHGITFDPPLDLEGVTGFRFGCEWENPRSESVEWGFGDQEMCEMLGFMDEEFAFESTVRVPELQAPEGDMAVFKGAECHTLLIPWASRQE